MIEKRGIYNAQGTWMNNYNNADEELFSDYQRPRDHEGFKIGGSEGVGISRFSGSSSGGSGGKVGSISRVKLSSTTETQYISSSNTVPTGLSVVKGSGVSISNNKIKIAKGGKYMFTIRAESYITSRASSGGLVIGLSHQNKFSDSGDLLDGSIIYATSPFITTARYTPFTVTGMGEVADGEILTLSISSVRRTGEDTTAVTLTSLDIELDIIKIG